MSLSESGASAFGVEPLYVLFRHNPFDMLTVPGLTSGVSAAGQCTSPRSLKTRTGFVWRRPPARNHLRFRRMPAG